ncbi:MAG: hypothetical protein OEU36_03490, partial [Gammaproteobacteria bacterium]|nr:hypothetical protein [Gammaproteobacteria bacterium]
MSRLSVEDVKVGLRLLGSLPSFLKTPLTLDAAGALLQERLKHRDRNFLALVHSGVYDRPKSLYRELLHGVGCEYGDLERLVRNESVEGALLNLLHKGVYLSVDEFKGRCAIRRGSLELAGGPKRLLNPASVVHGLSSTSGSGGHPTVVPIDLAFIRDHAVNTHLGLAAHGGAHWAHAHWGVPGGTAVTNPLEFAKGGNPPVKWFSPVDPMARDLHPRYRWGTCALRWGSALAGVPLPRAEHVPLDHPLAIAQWLEDVLRTGRVPHLWTFSSSAVRVCQAALVAGISLEGARFTMGGEPTTPARRRVVEQSGAGALPRFGSNETDILAFACREPEAPDQQHWFHDRHAVIQPGAIADKIGLPRRALVITSLLPTAPLLLLNVSLGDQADLTERSCGCLLEDLGWHTHVQNVLSFEKLTAGGFNFLDCDVVEVLEEVLPSRFGGSSNDYQLLEEQTSRCEPQVRLLVHPSVGDIDSEKLLNTFLQALCGGSSGARLMEMQWRQAGVVRIS